jgi:hypothetical protein
MRIRFSRFLTVLFFATEACFGDPVSINFDNLLDGAVVGNAYANQGVTFSNALVQAQGVSLSPLFPPASPPNVAINDPGAIMEIDFANPLNAFNAQFTYEEQLTVQFVNGNVIFKTLQGSCPFGNFVGACVTGPNEVISFNSDQPITEVRMYTASLQPDTFTIDNVTSVPEPASGFLLGTVLLALAVRWTYGAISSGKSSDWKPSLKDQSFASKLSSGGEGSAAIARAAGPTINSLRDLLALSLYRSWSDDDSAH